jgi:hypothetical protein
MPVQLAFYAVKRSDAFQGKKIGDLEPLSLLNVCQLAGCDDHDGPPDEVLCLPKRPPGWGALSRRIFRIRIQRMVKSTL